MSSGFSSLVECIGTIRNKKNKNSIPQLGLTYKKSETHHLRKEKVPLCPRIVSRGLSLVPMGSISYFLFTHGDSGRWGETGPGFTERFLVSTFYGSDLLDLLWKGKRTRPRPKLNPQTKEHRRRSSNTENKTPTKHQTYIKPDYNIWRERGLNVTDNTTVISPALRIRLRLNGDNPFLTLRRTVTWRYPTKWDPINYLEVIVVTS